MVRVGSKSLDLEEGNVRVRESLLLTQEAASSEGQQVVEEENKEENGKAATAVEKKKPKPMIGEDHTILEAVSTIDFWILFVSFLFGVGTGLAVMNNLGQMGLALGYSDVSIFVSLTNIWGFFGRIGSGSASEYVLKREQQVPCYFIFGDSLVDNGNNNVLATTSKANYPPYGIDFPDGFTGRFTNGQTTVDVIAELLGFTGYIPPFAAAKSSNITRGLNYGSGGAGIRDESGKEQGDNISFNRQLLNHKLIVSRIEIMMGGSVSGREYLGKCLYTVGFGSNDYINNYFLPQFYPTSSIYKSTDQYAAVLIQQYSQQLRTLYSYGARKIAVFGLGSLGCLPAEMAIFNTGGSACVDSINSAVQIFNNRLKSLVDDLKSNLSGAKFTFINIASIESDGLSNIGLKVVNRACCVVSMTAVGRGLCHPGQIPCSNRNEYLFYDNYHPTEVVNKAVAARSYVAVQPLDAYPLDIRSLVQVTS